MLDKGSENLLARSLQLNMARSKTQGNAYLCSLPQFPWLLAWG